MVRNRVRVRPPVDRHLLRGYYKPGSLLGSVEGEEYRPWPWPQKADIHSSGEAFISGMNPGMSRDGRKWGMEWEDGFINYLIIRRSFKICFVFMFGHHATKWKSCLSTACIILPPSVGDRPWLPMPPASLLWTWMSSNGRRRDCLVPGVWIFLCRHFLCP